MKKRVEWIDVCKAFGMFFIYLGHFGGQAGLAHPWVFSFHVPLFFFISGLLENYNHRGIWENLKKKFITIVLPFFFFGILMTAVQVVNENSAACVLGNLGILLRGGIRNTCGMEQSLWFLTCLFSIEILFSFIKKLNKKPLIFLLCLGLFFISELVMEPRPILYPGWYWNVDSAFYYMVYYCMGWLVFEPLENLLSSRSRRAVWGRQTAFLICTLYSGLLFFGTNIFMWFGQKHIFLGEIAMLIGPLPTIYMVVIISRYFSQNLFLQRIGQNSLYLCGNETFARLLVQLVLAMLGISVTISSPLQAYLYAGGLIAVVYFVLIPLEKPILSDIQKYVGERRFFRKNEEK